MLAHVAALALHHARVTAGGAGHVRARTRAARMTSRQGRARAVVGRYVHDGVSQPEEVLSRERLGEEVRHVRVRADEGHHDALLLHQLADEEVAALHVLDSIVVLGIVGQVASAGVVGGQLRRRSRRESQLGQEVREVHRLLLE